MIEDLQNIFHYLHGHFIFLQTIILLSSAPMAAVLIARQLERRWPADPNLSHSDIVADWKATGINVVAGWSAASITAVCGAAIVRAAGGGLIHLRTDGWWFGVSLLSFVLVSDLYRYCNHRLYHAVPFLWALHSFHHSAEAVTLATGARHHWMQRALETACLPVMAVLFRAPIDILTLASFILFLPDGCAHLNVRVPLGRAVTWINNPQWHRIHHSVLPEHQNKNFASLLTLWDFVFGTACIPRAGEVPATGLVPGEKCDVLTSIVWPFRRHLHHLRGLAPIWPSLRAGVGWRRIL